MMNSFYFLTEQIKISIARFIGLHCDSGSGQIFDKLINITDSIRHKFKKIITFSYQ